MWCPKLLNNTDHGGKRKKHQAPLKNWTPLAFSYIKLFGQKSHFFKGERSFEFFRVFKEVLFWGTQKFPNRDFNHRINKKVGCQFSLFWVKIYVSLSFWSEGYSNFGKHKKKNIGDTNPWPWTIEPMLTFAEQWTNVRGIFPKWKPKKKLRSQGTRFWRSETGIASSKQVAWTAVGTNRPPENPKKSRSNGETKHNFLAWWNNRFGLVKQPQLLQYKSKWNSSSPNCWWKFPKFFQNETTTICKSKSVSSFFDFTTHKTPRKKSVTHILCLKREMFWKQSQNNWEQFWIRILSKLSGNEVRASQYKHVVPPTFRKNEFKKDSFFSQDHHNSWSMKFLASIDALCRFEKLGVQQPSEHTPPNVCPCPSKVAKKPRHWAQRVALPFGIATSRSTLYSCQAKMLKTSIWVGKICQSWRAKLEGKIWTVGLGHNLNEWFMPPNRTCSPSHFYTGLQEKKHIGENTNSESNVLETVCGTMPGSGNLSSTQPGTVQPPRKIWV